MSILLSQLLQQIETKQDSNALTFEQATELYKLFILNNVKSQKTTLLKPLPLSNIKLAVNGSGQSVEIDATNQTPTKVTLIIDGKEKSCQVQVTQSVSKCIVYLMVDNQQTNITVTAVAPKNNEKITIDGKEEIIEVNAIKADLAKTSLVINEKKVIIENDINIAFRPRHEHLNKDFAQLSDKDLLSAIAVNTFEDTSFAKGSMTELVRSVKQYHYNNETNQFEGKDKNKKVFRRAIPGTESVAVAEPSADEKNIITTMLGKEGNRGLYWLNNGISISPFIDGFSLDKFIGRQEHRNLLKSNPFELKKWAIMLLVRIALLHEKGFVHQDAKPANFMHSNGKIHIIDYDFLRSLQTVLADSMGTLEYIPLSVLNEVTDSKKANPYQDIYGILVTISLLLNPDIKKEFSALTQTLLHNFRVENKGAKSLIVDMTNLENFLTYKAQKHPHPWFKEVISSALQDKTTTALQLISNLLATDHETMRYFSGVLLSNNPEQLNELNAHIALHYKKHSEILKSEREELASYVAECLIGKITYSADKFNEKFGTAHEVELNLEEELLDSLLKYSDEVLETRPDYVINFINQSILSNDKLALLKERIAKMQIALLQKNPGNVVVRLTACLLTAGNQKQVDELMALYEKWQPLVNFPGRPEFKKGCDSIISVLITGLSGETPYNHASIENIRSTVDGANISKYAAARRANRGIPSGSMFSPGAMKQNSDFSPQPVPGLNQQQPVVPTPVLPSKT